MYDTTTYMLFSKIHRAGLENWWRVGESYVGSDRREQLRTLQPCTRNMYSRVPSTYEPGILTRQHGTSVILMVIN